MHVLLATLCLAALAPRPTAAFPLGAAPRGRHRRPLARDAPERVQPRTAGRSRVLCASARDDAPPESSAGCGHLFVMQGDARRIMADAVLVPTRNLSNTVWFPDGPPAGARAAPRRAFTNDQRVHPLAGLRSDEPCIFLGWLWWEGDGAAPISWFVDAAEQFLRDAYALTVRRGRSLCRRELPLLALPVVGPGRSGARDVSGALLTALMRRLSAFCDEHRCDIVLVTRSPQMLSAAQSTRRKLERRQLQQSSWSLLGPQLLSEARRLARLASEGQV